MGEDSEQPGGGDGYAFLGTMGARQAFAEDSAAALPSNFEDGFQTMALVEACYRSSQHPAEPIPYE